MGLKRQPLMSRNVSCLHPAGDLSYMSPPASLTIHFLSYLYCNYTGIKKKSVLTAFETKNMTDKLLPLGFLSLKCLCVESVIIECLYKMLSSYLKCLSVLLSDLQIHTFWKPTHGAFHLLFNVHILIWPVMQSHRIHGAVVVTVTTKMKNWNADLLGMNICRCCHKMFLRRHTVFTWLCH